MKKVYLECQECEVIFEGYVEEDAEKVKGICPECEKYAILEVVE